MLFLVGQQLDYLHVAYRHHQQDERLLQDVLCHRLQCDPAHWDQLKENLNLTTTIQIVRHLHLRKCFQSGKNLLNTHSMFIKKKN